MTSPSVVNQSDLGDAHGGPERFVTARTAYWEPSMKDLAPGGPIHASIGMECARGQFA